MRNLLEPSRNDENAAIQKPSLVESQPPASDQIHCSPVPALGEVGDSNEFTFWKFGFTYS